MLKFKQFLLELINPQAIIHKRYGLRPSEDRSGAEIQFKEPLSDASGKKILKNPKIIPHYRLQKNENKPLTKLLKTPYDAKAVRYFANKMKKGESTEPAITTKIPDEIPKEQPWKTDLALDGHHRFAASTVSRTPLKSYDVPKDNVEVRISGAKLLKYRKKTVI